ncbi:MAG: glycosyl hydrolase 115 family protein, partial [Lachnospiraceae bacterium]|nr:glycosyl hydrolase 115 family protein [Lachnospiraceae bacterium]
LADKMGVIIGTSHCDMLMRSNHREWEPWKKSKGYTDAVYDYSIPGRNREILEEYWRESVEQNSPLEVTYTLGMRGIHDSGFQVSALKGLTGEELIKAKIDLLQTVIEKQVEILDTVAGPDTQKNFVPYKEVLELYDNGLKVPEDFTLIWVNDNYGYVRRYPNAAEKQRKGGNGLSDHHSYWSPPGNSYLFIDTIPLAHTANELKKAYNEGIRKLWITNFGAIKPLEEEMSFFADLAWDAGKDMSCTDDVDKWLTVWLDKTFTIKNPGEIAKLLNDLDQLTNVRKVEHMDIGVFPLETYGDEGAYRLHRYEEIFKKCNDAYKSLPEEERDAFFQLVLTKVHAAYYTNLMFYYADRSALCIKQGKSAAAQKYTALSLDFDILRRKLIKYYNDVMHDGKWKGILTPEDFPPPRTTTCPACMPPLFEDRKHLVVTTFGCENRLDFSGQDTKWIEAANAGAGELSYRIELPSWLTASKTEGKVSEEERILITNTATSDVSGFITVSSPETGESKRIFVIYGKKSEDEGRITIEGTDYTEISGKVSLIPRLGRDHGSLVQLDESDASVTYSFEMSKNADDAAVVIHRFPTLNSVGRIRCWVMIDGVQHLYEAETRDEHMGHWKENVQNNVDTSVSIPLKLKKGMHSLKLIGIDRYFSFTRIEILTEKKAAGNLGFTCYGGGLPKEFDTLSFAKEFYHVTDTPLRREVFATAGAGTNANIDYDTYRDDLPEVPVDEWRKKSYDVISSILEAGESPVTEDDNELDVDLASALIGSEHARIVNNDGELSYCNGPSHQGLGLALMIRDREKTFSKDRAPYAEYTLECGTDGKYRMWAHAFMWGKDRSHFEISVDDTRYTDADWFKPGVWAFSCENTWRFVPLVDVELKKGMHRIKVHFLDPMLRLDRISFTACDALPRRL